MDRVINVKVGGNYISKDNKNAGVRGEANVTYLRITFDDSWIDYAKKVTFWDALGRNPVERTLTLDLCENIADNTTIYLVPIPGEPLAEAGTLTFVIDGYIEGKRQRSMSDKLEVKDAPLADNAGEPTDPIPTPAEQWQEQIEMLAEDIAVAYIARDEAGEYAKAAENAKDSAEESAEKAETAVGKTSYIGDNGHWYAWDGTKKEWYDTGVRAQAGSTVWVGDNPPEDADVWINPDGKLVTYITPEELEEAISDLINYVLVLVNKAAPTDAVVRLYANKWVQESATKWHQVVVVEGATITEYSQIDLKLDEEQVEAFANKTTSLVAINEDGVVTVTCTGKVPENDYVIQARVSEVYIDG